MFLSFLFVRQTVWITPTNRSVMTQQFWLKRYSKIKIKLITSEKFEKYILGFRKAKSHNIFRNECAKGDYKIGFYPPDFETDIEYDKEEVRSLIFTGCSNITEKMGISLIIKTGEYYIDAPQKVFLFYFPSLSVVMIIAFIALFGLKKYKEFGHRRFLICSQIILCFLQSIVSLLLIILAMFDKYNFNDFNTFILNSVFVVLYAFTHLIIITGLCLFEKIPALGLFILYLTPFVEICIFFVAYFLDNAYAYIPLGCDLILLILSSVYIKTWKKVITKRDSTCLMVLAASSYIAPIDIAIFIAIKMHFNDIATSVIFTVLLDTLIGVDTLINFMFISIRKISIYQSFFFSKATDSLNDAVYTN